MFRFDRSCPKLRPWRQIFATDSSPAAASARFRFTQNLAIRVTSLAEHAAQSPERPVNGRSFAADILIHSLQIRCDPMRLHADTLKPLNQKLGCYSASKGSRLTHEPARTPVRIVYGRKRKIVLEKGPGPLKPLLGTGPSVRAPRPATRPPFAFGQFLNRATNSLSSSGRELGRSHPADPLVASQGRELAPSLARPWVGVDCGFEFGRNSVHWVERSGLGKLP
jgi:hypothetical protein